MAGDDWLLVGALCAAAAAKLTVLLRHQRRRPTTAVLAGRVSALHVYPFKSCQGISSRVVLVTEAGVAMPDCPQIRDRQFMAVRPGSNRFVSQRQYGQLALVRVSYQDVSLLLDAPDMRTLVLPLRPRGSVVQCSVWDNYMLGVDCGDAAAEWMTSYLGTEVRVVFTSPDVDSRGLPDLGETKWHKYSSDHHKVGFADFAPYLLTSESSLEDLNTRMATPVTMKRFRPNIVVQGSAPYDEDDWRELYIGEEGVKLLNLKPCSRCVLTTVDPETGRRNQDSQPLSTLKTYRKDEEIDPEGPMFGVNLFPEVAGVVCVGDPVYVIRGKRFVPPGPI